MRRLSLSLVCRSERGAVAAIVAVLFSGMAIMGCIALTVDLGQMNNERRELQNGADAVALSVAKTCATTASCLSDSSTFRQGLADGNAADGNTAISAICGVGSGLNPCPTPQPGGRLAECVIPATMPDEYVRVYTQTPSATPLILPFSRALGGSGGTPRIQACAQAALTALGSTGQTLPITLGECQWIESTKNGFAPSPPYSPGPGNQSTSLPNISPGKVVGITAHDPGQDYSNKCGSKNGMFYSGGFGWTVEDGSCNVTWGSTGDVVLDGSNGASPPNGCKANNALSKYLGKEVFVPVFGQPTAKGYQIVGLASFFFAGYQKVPAATPQGEDVYKMPNTICSSKNTTCLWGWFTKPLVPVGSFGSGGADLGPKTVSLLG
jgi:hypothetical protein